MTPNQLHELKAIAYNLSIKFDVQNELKRFDKLVRRATPAARRELAATLRDMLNEANAKGR